MNCSDAKKLISVAQDGALDGRRQEELLRHLSGCAGCAAYKTELEALRAAIPAPRAIAPSPYFYAKVRQKIRADEERTVPFFARLRWLVPSAIAAAMLSALFTGTFFGRSLWTSYSPNTSSDVEIVASAFGLNAFDDGPEGSITAVYNEVKG